MMQSRESSRYRVVTGLRTCSFAEVRATAQQAPEPFTEPNARLAVKLNPAK